MVLRSAEVQKLLDKYSVPHEEGRSGAKSGAAQGGYLGGSPSETGEDPASYYGYENFGYENETPAFAPPNIAAKAGAKAIAASMAEENVNEGTEAQEFMPERTPNVVRSKFDVVSQNGGNADISLDYDSLYDMDADEYELQKRFSMMEKPLAEKSEICGNFVGIKGYGGKGGENRKSDTSDFEKALNKVMEPVMRAQARVIKLLNESRREAPVASLPIPAPNSSDKMLSRIEEKLNALKTDAEAVRTDGGVREELASLRDFIEASLAKRESAEAAPDKETAVGISKTDLETLRETLQKDLDAIRSDVNTISLGGEENAERFKELETNLDGLQKKYDLLLQKYNNVRIEHERFVAEHAEYAAKNNVAAILDRLEALREPLDAHSLSNEDFAQKIVEHVEELKIYIETLEGRYEACEEETSTLQLMVDKLQSENGRLKEENKNFSEQIDQLGSSDKAYDKLKAEYDELKEASDTAKETYLKLQEQYLVIKDRNQELSDEVQALTALQSEKEAEAERLQEELVAVRTASTSSGAQMDELESMVEEAARSEQEALAKAEELENQLAELSEANEANEAKAAEAEAALEKAEAENEQFKEELEECRARLKVLEEEQSDSASANDQALQEAQKEIVSLQDQLQQQREIVAQISSESALFSSNMEAEKTKLLRLVSSLQAKNEDLTAQLGNSGSKNSDGAIEAAEQMIRNLQNELQDAKDKLQEAERQLAEEPVGGELDELTAQNEELREEIEALRYELDNKDAAAGFDAPEDLMAELQALEAETEVKDRMLEDARQETSGLREELDRLKKALFEQQQLYEREHKEWSEIVKKQVRGEEVTTSQDSARGGFRLFKNRSSNL